MTEKVFHLVVRFSDTMFGIGDVVSKHNEMVSMKGSVWFGKLGSVLAQERIDLLNKQIEHGTPTFLYLVKGNRKKSTAYRANLLFISRDMPKERKYFPAYYREKKLLKNMKVWMNIGRIEPIELSAMKLLKAKTSVSPFTETLALSSSGHFLVHESKHIF